LTPLLSLLLVHDYLFSGSNIAASKDHPLKIAVLRHKARLSAEFTKARIRRKCATVSQLKVTLAGDQKSSTILQPRWVRVNGLVSDGKDLFPGHSNQPVLKTLMTTYTGQNSYHQDKYIPDLLALPPGTDLTKSAEYKVGKIILQDKASCFPAYLLLGEEDEEVGDVIDACAAPGNKTTHLASILWSRGRKHLNRLLDRPLNRVFACERDLRRSEILQKMVHVAAGESVVTVMPKQDFFALDPDDPRFVNVTHLLLDPTCSGSGIVGREDIPKLNLPEDPRSKGNKLPAKTKNGVSDAQSKKRKRDKDEKPSEAPVGFEEEEVPREIDEERLQKLSNLQTRIIERAMSFPAARRITYSTCSLHTVENEMVVARALHSTAAKARGWRLLRRDEQVKGIRKWVHRGVDVAPDSAEEVLTEEERLACVRCYPSTEEGTMGFFVCCFMRNSLTKSDADSDPDEDEWGGIDD
jgi:25S rRNA (cytosine2278-C5)-methyltransferase